MRLKIILPWLGYLIAAVVLVWFFSYRLLQTPLGLTADEGGFGINATLLARTGHDENGRFLPVFILSLNGTDWRQPVTQYYLALLFKIFGPGVFLLRFSSVLITLLSTGLIFYLVRRMTDRKWAAFAAFVFVTTPLIMIQSHLGLDNIMPVPFALLWLICLYLWGNHPQPKYLLWVGMALGVAFYSYKGMRATVPVWGLLTLIYIASQDFKHKIRNAFWLGLGAGPFLLAAPFLEMIYPGAVFDGQGFKWDTVYSFLYPYFSSFDPSFLFILGDATPWHSTGKHGMMLLASLPLFVLGIWESVKHKGFRAFTLASFFIAPLLFGFVESVHRASRLMAIIPAYVLICVWGARWLWSKNRAVLAVLVGLMIINFSDFTYFYWYKYPELSRQWFGDLSAYQDYRTFGRLAKTLNLQPFVEDQVASRQDINAFFWEEAYLGSRAGYLTGDEPLPEGGLLMSTQQSIPGLVQLEVPMVKYRLFRSVK